ncbi:MAG: 4-hydroxythreonine-4-phosphate dehydrogenase PdxA [Gemmatimonadetes bacterium]|nr:4-hydroxythreonine-4-phosphate dehydrogenase PdxA [Gemmatimonadota bacterium]
MPVTVAITLGDPRGIGPEVTRAAVRSFRDERPDVALLILGPRALDPGVGPYVDVGAWDGSEPSAGAVAGAAIERAVALALAGDVHAIVTAPIHKPALARAGYTSTGHTELLKELTGVPAVGMLMAAERTELGPPLRVLLATTHHALRDVADLVSADLLVEQTALLREGLRTGWRIAEPRIGLCALNPHASDGGLFGDEEERVYGPAVRRLAAAGTPVSGPLPADTVFRRALDGELDAVVAPYHDVGMAAFKTVAFGGGVNVTLGLPFVRTSPDHGTAFDIAGQGRADAASMLEALRLAVRLAENRFDTSSGRG